MPTPNGAEAGELQLQLVLGLLVLGLIAFTAVAFFTPNVQIAFVNERLDLMINSVATAGAGAIAALAWARYRVTAEGRSFYQAGTFLTLASVNAGVMTALAMDRGPELGFSSTIPARFRSFRSSWRASWRPRCC